MHANDSAITSTTSRRVTRSSYTHTHTRVHAASSRTRARYYPSPPSHSRSNHIRVYSRALSLPCHCLSLSLSSLVNRNACTRHIKIMCILLHIVLCESRVRRARIKIYATRVVCVCVCLFFFSAFLRVCPAVLGSVISVRSGRESITTRARVAKKAYRRAARAKASRACVLSGCD